MTQNFSNSFLRSSSVSALILGLGSSAFIAPDALADCPVIPLPESDRAIQVRLGLTQAVLDHQDRYDSGGDFLMLEEGGWGDPTRADEYTNHFYASFLALHGVEGTDPPIRQSPTSGAWEYDPDGLILSNNFHRSWDGYGPLVYDRELYACMNVNPQTGAPACTQSSRYPFFLEIGNGTGSAVVDSFPEDPKSTARYRPIWDLFRDPDWLLEYNCGSISTSTGAVLLARTMVHENWHSTGTSHVDGTSGPRPPGSTNYCSGEAGRCDTYRFVSAHNEVYHGIALARKKA
jgi:hypothetical protein